MQRLFFGRSKRKTSSRYWHGNKTMFIDFFLAAFGFVAVIFCLVVVIFSFPLQTSMSKGKFGERKIAKILSKLDPAVYHVMNDIMLSDGIRGTTQIDHVVFSVYGIFVIETKYYSGWIFGDFNSKRWCQSIYGVRSYFQNPYRQNYKHICCLSGLTGVPINSFVQVVAFTGNCSVRTIEKLPKSFVTTGDELCKFILSHKVEILSQRTIERVEKTVRSSLIEKNRVSLNAHRLYVKQRKEQG